MLGIIIAKGYDVVKVGEELHASLGRISDMLPVGVDSARYRDKLAVVTKAVSSSWKLWARRC